MGFYEKYVKRFLDIICSFFFIVFFFWVYIIIAIIVLIKMGSPVLFKQPRPGIVKNGKETIFDLYKFRTMTDKRDESGKLLSDDQRLTKFGAMLRSTSLDELPEIFCVLRGTMSIVGPRPQLVRDMVFMSDEHRMRHTAKPGITGLAQVNGRNAVSWEEKLDWDLKYIENVSLFADAKILFRTVTTVIKRSGITDGYNATALDYGDALLKEGKVSKQQYDTLLLKSKEILEEYQKR
ncbi:MAG: sugar transferase [Lachnospiraceae bacterium]|nr:sugar transferase [Lachnospiraceae bacterium]